MYLIGKNLKVNLLGPTKRWFQSSTPYKSKTAQFYEKNVPAEIKYLPYIIFADRTLMVVSKPHAMKAVPDEYFDIESKQVKRLLPHSPELLVQDKPRFKAWQNKLIKANLDLVSYLKLYLKVTENKPGDVYLAPINRIDQAASGLSIFCPRDKFSNRLAKQFRERTIEKEYLAVVEDELQGHGVVPGGKSCYTSFWENQTIRKNPNLVRLKSKKKDKPVKKYTDGDFEWAAIHQFCGHSFREDNTQTVKTVVVCKTKTGGKHQVRRQLAQLGHPIVGDTLYGSRHKFKGKNRMLRCEERILLHASKITLQMPWKNGPMKTFEAPVPKNFLEGTNMNIYELGDFDINVMEAKRSKNAEENPEEITLEDTDSYRYGKFTQTRKRFGDV